MSLLLRFVFVVDLICLGNVVGSLFIVYLVLLLMWLLLFV